MNNRFLGVKTLGDLYLVFSNEDVSDYDNLTETELERVADVFEANLPNKVDMPDRPLTEAGYTLIWNVTVDTVEEFINNNITGEEAPEKDKEVKIMNDNLNITMEEAVKEFTETSQEVINDLFDDAGKKKEQVVDDADKGLVKLKAAMLKVLGVLDAGLGYSVLKDSIVSIIDAGTTGGKVKSLKAMQKECKRLIEVEISSLEFWGDEESLKKAVQLKALTEGARGKSVFEAFVSGILWTWDRISNKLKSWLPDFSDKKGLLLSICRGIKDGFKKLAGYVARFVKFAVSAIVATVVWAADLIVSAIMSFVKKIKGWAEIKHEAAQAKKEAAATEDIINNNSGPNPDDYFQDDDFDDDEDLNVVIQ